MASPRPRPSRSANRRLARRAVAVTLAGVLAACAVGPDYQRPSAPVTPKFKEAEGWRPSDPADGIDKGAWWSMFDDPVLNDLEQRVAASNQTVKQFEAAYREAHAVVAEARSAFFPTVASAIDLQRSRNGGGGTAGAGKAGGVTGVGGAPTGTSTVAVGQLEATWVPDLWGKVRRTVRSEKSLAQASAADVANARLAAQAALAQAYFQLRVLDEEAALFRETITGFREFLRITQVQYREGTQPYSAVITAQTQLLGAESSLIAIGVTRAQMEHAIAVLTGAPPATLTIAPAPLSRRVPVTPAGVPSTLLERRPDIASAERQVSAANEQIGIAIAAYFPDLTLAGDYGGSGGSLANLFSAGASFWSLGADVTETLFAFGLRHAQVTAARAAYDESVANYRQTVLTAFQGVEDQLAALRVYQQQEAVLIEAETAAQEAVRLALAEYREGTVDYTTVVTAQTTALTASVNVLTALQLRLQASVLLVENLGGGWRTADLPTS